MRRSDITAGALSRTLLIYRSPRGRARTADLRVMNPPLLPTELPWDNWLIYISAWRRPVNLA